MQVNHEEVDRVLGGRRKRIEDNMKHMQRGVEAQSEGWSEVRTVCRPKRRQDVCEVAWRSKGVHAGLSRTGSRSESRSPPAVRYDQRHLTFSRQSKVYAQYTPLTT